MLLEWRASIFPLVEFHLIKSLVLSALLQSFRGNKVFLEDTGPPVGV